MAEVDPEQRGAALAGQLGGPQDRAVAADDDDELAVRGGARRVGSTTSTLGEVQLQLGGLVARAAATAMPCVVQRPAELARRRRGPRARPVWAITRTRRSSAVLRGWSRSHPLTGEPPGPRCDVPRRRSRSSPTVAGAAAQPEEELDVARRPGQRAGGDRLGAPAAARGGRRRPRSTASARRSRSRTTPPLPTRSLPTSNCGLTISARSPSGAGHADQRVEHQVERDEGEVADDQVDGPADQLGRQVADVGAVVHDAPARRCCSDQASWP